MLLILNRKTISSRSTVSWCLCTNRINIEDLAKTIPSFPPYLCMYKYSNVGNLDRCRQRPVNGILILQKLNNVAYQMDDREVAEEG